MQDFFTMVYLSRNQRLARDQQGCLLSLILLYIVLDADFSQKLKEGLAHLGFA